MVNAHYYVCSVEICQKKLSNFCGIIKIVQAIKEVKCVCVQCIR